MGFSLPARLLVHLQRQYNPSGLPVRSQGCTYNPTGLPVHSQGTPSDKPQINIPPLTFPPHPGFYVLCYISYKRQHSSVCVLARCGFQSSGILVALWTTCVVLSRYVISPVACPSACLCVIGMDSAGPQTEHRQSRIRDVDVDPN